MPHHKKSRLDGPVADAAVSAVKDRDSAAMANELSGDVVAIIFGFFPPEDIMRMRCVCKKWREAAKRTIVPMADFSVDSVDEYNAIRVMATVLPNLQQLSIRALEWGHKYIEGEDADERRARYHASETSHDINIISNFKKLRVLYIYKADLNGRYPVLFDFPLLHKLFISDCRYLKFDLGMLSGLPLLKEFVSTLNPLTGDIRNLRVLKETIEKVKIFGHNRVEGNFMDFADFPRLKQLKLIGGTVTGDIRDISRHDFPALEQLCLPWTVRGGNDYNFQSISDVPSFMQAVHLLMQRTPDLFELFKEDSFSYLYDFNWNLSASSPDWYDYDDESEVPTPPFHLKLVQAGSRLGWVWCSYRDEEYREDDGRYFCEINWLDPEPGSESSDYATYVEALQRIEERIDFYRGYSQPPTLAEYNQLCDEYPRYSD